MACLILDTSTDQCLIALIDGTRILDQKFFSHHNLLAKLLLPEIQTLLQKNDLAPTELTSLAVGIGPGSYTGTRLGVSVGKSLAFGLKIPFKGFSSPLAFLPDREGVFAFLVQARSGSFFVLKGTLSASFIQQNSAVILSPEDMVMNTQDVDFFIVSPKDILPESLAKRPIFSPSPNIKNLSLLLSKTSPVPLENVEIFYLHNPF